MKWFRRFEWPDVYEMPKMFNAGWGFLSFGIISDGYPTRFSATRAAWRIAIRHMIWLIKRSLFTKKGDYED